MVSSIGLKKTLQVLNNGLKTALGHSYYSLKRIFAYSKSLINLIIIGNIALFLGVILNILLPTYIGKILDAMTSDNQTEELKSIIQDLGLILFGTIVLMLIKEAMFDLLAINVIQSMRKDL